MDQEKHQLKLRKPLPAVVDFEIADWMFSCESPPASRALLQSDFGSVLRGADALPPDLSHVEHLQLDALQHLQATATSSPTPPSCASTWLKLMLRSCSQHI